MRPILTASFDVVLLLKSTSTLMITSPRHMRWLEGKLLWVSDIVSVPSNINDCVLLQWYRQFYVFDFLYGLLAPDQVQPFEQTPQGAASHVNTGGKRNGGCCGCYA